MEKRKSNGADGGDLRASKRLKVVVRLSEVSSGLVFGRGDWKRRERRKEASMIACAWETMIASGGVVAVRAIRDVACRDKLVVALGNPKSYATDPAARPTNPGLVAEDVRFSFSTCAFGYSLSPRLHSQSRPKQQTAVDSHTLLVLFASPFYFASPN
jgi:hypothetical protein